MNAEIKKCADAKDVKGLRYIFVDCLDVDPTFESYEEDYEYCKKIKDFFVDFEEITPLKSDSFEWNEDYWVKLKVDLLKNFSEKRFLHMIEVAKVVKAEKIKRLQQERQALKTEQEKSNFMKDEPNKLIQPVQNISFDADKQEKQTEEKRKKLELENQRVQEKIDRDERERAERKEKLKAEEIARKQQMVSANNSSKKVWGIVAVAVVILIIILAAVLH